MGTFNKLAGNHSLKLGLDYRMINWNERSPDTSFAGNGRFLFDYAMTAADPTKNTTGGSAMASLLLGYPTTNSGSNGSRVRQGTDLSLRNHYMALFFQDDWKISQRLTVNLGLRYEMETPFTERFDRQAYSFDATAPIGVTVDVPVFDASGKMIGTQPKALAGGLTFANEGGNPRRQGKIDWNNFGPRIGARLLAEREDGAARRLRHLLRVRRPEHRQLADRRRVVRHGHAVRRFERRQPDDHPGRQPAEPLPAGLQRAHGERGGDQHAARGLGHRPQRELRAPVHAAVAGERPARAAVADARRGGVRRHPRASRSSRTSTSTRCRTRWRR